MNEFLEPAGCCFQVLTCRIMRQVPARLPACPACHPPAHLLSCPTFPCPLPPALCAVGVNGGSAPPAVPHNTPFIWRDPPSGKQLLAMWHPGGYSGFPVDGKHECVQVGGRAGGHAAACGGTAYLHVRLTNNPTASHLSTHPRCLSHLLRLPRLCRWRGWTMPCA